LEGGTCYDDGESFQRNNFDMCSDTNSRAPTMFKYMTCPNEDACGKQDITPSYSGEVLYREIDKYNHIFAPPDVCTWRIIAPYQMSKYDEMHLKIISIDKADVYVAKSKSYFWLDHLDSVASAGSQYDTKQNWRFFVVAAARDILNFKGFVKFKVWIEHKE